MRATVLIGVLGVLVGVVVATGGRTAGASSTSARTLTVVIDPRQSQVRDLSSGKPQIGDFRTSNSVLLNAKATKAIGRADTFSVVTQEAGVRSPGLHLNESIFTFKVPGGMLTGQSMVARAQSTLAPLPGVGAITGGTGQYSGARGQFQYSRHGTQLTITFRLLP